MKIEIQNNEIIVKINDNFEPMVAYLYLLAFEFVSNGLFVPSINPPKSNIYLPRNLIGNEQVISYFKTVRLLIKNDKTVQLKFETINDAKAFKEAMEQSW